MKQLLFPLFLFGVLLIAAAKPARAEVPITAVLYEADAAGTGFKERYRWRFNRTDDWRRFEFIMSKMPEKPKAEVSPFVTKPKELVVLTVKDPNGITGKDYYISANGIMVTALKSHDSFYLDDNNFFVFLKEQVLKKSSFESYPGEKFTQNEPGLVVRYRINATLSNPSWLINEQKDVNTYDSFMRDLTEYQSRITSKMAADKTFEKIGNFVILLNYPGAPARFATVGGNGIRLSQTYVEDTFLADERNYFRYFRNMAQESMKLRTQAATKDKTQEEKGQF